MPDKLSRQELRERLAHFEDMLEAGEVQSGEMRLPSASPLATEKQAISWITCAASTAAGARAWEPPATGGSTLVPELESKGAPGCVGPYPALPRPCSQLPRSAQTAAAVEPIREDFSFSDTIVLADVCSFPVTVEYTITGTKTTFFDENGSVTRIQIHNVEQDVFSANGRTLVGLPYTFNLQVLFDPDSGEVTHVFATGVASRVPLPGGDFFLTAGRLDFAAHPGEPFLIQPDVGAQGNLEGFCAALSP